MFAKIFGALPLAAALLVSTAHAAPADDLQRVIADHWTWWLSINPVQATTLGVRDYDDHIRDISLAEADREAQAAQAFLDRLKAIPDAGLSNADLTNKGVLARMLSDQIEGNRYGERMMLFTTYDGWHQAFAGMADNLPFRTRADYESYLKRLSLYPGLNGEAIAISRKAVAKGYVQPCDAMRGFEDTITGAVAGKPEDTRFFGPFRRARPIDLGEADWTAMKARAIAVIRNVVAPEYGKFAQFYLTEYKPKCRKTVGASAMPEGAAWYAFQARSHTTTTLTPEQIHAIGLSEVARIRAEMVKVSTDAGYPSREAFIARLRTDPSYYAKTPEELMAAASRIAKQIDGKMPEFFGRLPRLPYGVREIPKETAETTTTAYYNAGSPESGIAGNYYVNTSKLSQRPLWELPARSRWIGRRVTFSASRPRRRLRLTSPTVRRAALTP